MSCASFVHLHVHSGFSLLASSARVAALIEQAKTYRMPALALTDQGNLFAAIPFFTGCIKAGIKPILGSQLYLVPDRHARPDRPDKEIKDQLILLCRNQEGWQNLMRLVSAGHLEGSHDKPRIDARLLQKYHQGLIALSAAHKGEIGRHILAGKIDKAEKAAITLRDLFQEEESNTPGFFIELQRHGLEYETELNAALVALAHRVNIPLVASNDIHFIHEKDHRAHDALVCIGMGHTLYEEKRPHFSNTHGFRSPDTMASLFADLPEAIANTLLIAQRCNLQLDLGKTVLPNYTLPEGETLSSWLRTEAKNGLENRLQGDVLLRTAPEEQETTKTQYMERLEYELDVILQMGFPGYFLIVSDFIRWAKQQGIPVGPGRGSGAGSVVAWAMDITDLDPIRYQLLFERFLNPERVSMPDFDVDFCMDRREEVINYVQDKYGKDRVAQIITFGTLQAKMVIRDVGRVLEFPYGRVDRIAKLVPNVLGINLKEAIEQEERLSQMMKDEEDVNDLIGLAISLEGMPRSAGTHAAGVVMANGPLTDMVPLYRDPRSTMPVTQFNMGDVEKAGLVKFDFLGLKTLTVIDEALKLVNHGREKRGEKAININQIDMEDRKTFQLLQSGQTKGVFQLESSGMREILKKLAPDAFEEIIALVALYRPGPLGSGMVDDFINRKHKRIEVSYPLPMLEPILKETFGVILYQEQVMKIAQTLAGYSLGGADLLRRAMGKKKMQEMISQREIFLKGATANGITEERANFIFDLMEKFAGYGFNKSHSAAYALISYQTAWLKAHYGVEFMAATLTCDMLNSDKVAIFVRECKELGIVVQSPDVNLSFTGFTVEAGEKEGEQQIRYGMAAVKNVGEGAVLSLLESRKRDGPFHSLLNLCQRTEGLNRRMMEHLIKAGACDSFGHNRATLLHGLPNAMSLGSKKQENQSLGFMQLFDDVDEENLTEIPDHNPNEKLTHEKDALGFYITGHPMDHVRQELEGYGLPTIGELKLEVQDRRNSKEVSVTVAGMLVGRKLHMTKKGDRMAFLTLEDAETQIEITVFSDVYTASHELLEEDAILLVKGSVDTTSGEDEVKLLAEGIHDLKYFRETQCREMRIECDILFLSSELLDQLFELVNQYSGESCWVVIHLKFSFASGSSGSGQSEHDTLQCDAALATLRLGKEFCVLPNQEVLDKVRELFGTDSVSFHRDISMPS